MVARYGLAEAFFVFEGGKNCCVEASFQLSEASFDRSDGSFIVHNTSSKVHNTIFIVNNASLKVHNAIFIFHTPSFKVNNESCKVHKGSFKAHIVSFMVHNTNSIVYYASFNNYCACFKEIAGRFGVEDGKTHSNEGKFIITKSEIKSSNEVYKRGKSLTNIIEFVTEFKKSSSFEIRANDHLPIQKAAKLKVVYCRNRPCRACNNKLRDMNSGPSLE